MSGIRRYDEEILNRLLDKYENSLLYTGENRRQQNIGIAVTKELLPEYFDESSGRYEVIHAQLMEVEEKGFLKLEWKNKRVGHILERCVLCPEKADEIYVFLHRRPKMEKENTVIHICDEFAGRHPVIDRFLDWVRDRLGEKKSVKQYLDMDHPEEFRGRLRLMEEILMNTEEVFWREFSVRFRKDSKAAEKEIITAAGIIARFSADEGLRELEPEQVLEEFGIYKNPSWVMMKGCGRFWMMMGEAGSHDGRNIARKADSDNGRKGEPGPENGNWLSLESFPGGIGLSSEDIAYVHWDKTYLPGQVVTIENLTSFHRFLASDALVIYLGGYHNKGKRRFLMRLYESCKNENVAFIHFGDIDCGGFQIWRDLGEKTRIPFQTGWMDMETYLSHLQYGKALTTGDRERLKRMAQDPYFAKQRELFLTMLEKGVKVEQECVRCC